MNLDLATVIFQIANFLIVVWLLNRFLFRPVMRNMTLREEAIQKRLGDAENAKKNAEAKEAAAARQISDFENSKSEMMHKAMETVHHEEAAEKIRFKDEMVAKKEAFRHELETERLKAADQVKEQVGRAFLETLRKTFFLFGSAKLEEALLDNFIKLIPSHISPAPAGTVTIVMSSFPIPQKKRAALKRAVKARSVEFKTSDDILCGIRIVRGDLELSFSLDDYMDELYAKITEVPNA